MRITPGRRIGRVAEMPLFQGVLTGVRMSNVEDERADPGVFSRGVSCWLIVADRRRLLYY